MLKMNTNDSETLMCTYFKTDFLRGSFATVVLFIGVFGNGVVIISISRQKKMLQKPYYYLVLHLAIWDFANQISMVESIYENLTGKTSTISSTMCNVIELIYLTFLTAGIKFMIAISILRVQHYGIGSN